MLAQPVINVMLQDLLQIFSLNSKQPCKLMDHFLRQLFQMYDAVASVLVHRLSWLLCHTLNISSNSGLTVSHSQCWFSVRKHLYTITKMVVSNMWLQSTLPSEMQI